MDQDILFRGSLILCIMILAGIFGAGLSDSMDKVRNDDITQWAEDLGKIISGTHLAGTGSQVRLDIGVGGPVEDGAVGIAAEILPQGSSLAVYPGLIYLQAEGEKVVVSEGPWIIPAVPPNSTRKVNRTVMREIAMVSGGYEVELPAIISLHCSEVSEDFFLFVHPGDIEYSQSANHSSAMTVILREPILLPGWKMDAVIGINEIHGISNNLILFKMESEFIAIGKCPLPLMIPPSFEIQIPDVENGDSSTKLHISKEALLENDGNVTLSQRVWIE
jgi:hypothetical protein